MRALRILAASVIAASVSVAAHAGTAGKTPQETFSTIQKAAATDDHKTFFNCVEPAGQDELLLAMTVGSAFIVMGRPETEQAKIQGETEAILKKHKVDNSEELDLSAGKEAARAAAKKMFAHVDDKPALYQDLVMHIKKYANKSSEAGKAKLSDVKVEGAKASGTVERADGKKVSMTFVQQGDKWYVSAADTKTLQ